MSLVGLLSGSLSISGRFVPLISVIALISAKLINLVPDATGVFTFNLIKIFTESLGNNPPALNPLPAVSVLVESGPALQP